MYLFLDTETGGIGADYSLLTAYFVATDDNFKKIDDLYLYLKPDDGIYRVCGEAMGINKINLSELDKQSLTYTKAGTQLYGWLQKLSNDGKDKLIVVGHNVRGDRDDIVRTIISRGTWDKFCSYRLRDTQTIACYFIDCGIIKDISGSLESLCEYFKIPFNKNDLHDARVDTEKTMTLYKALIDMGKALRRDAKW